jgi:tetratricopeptide (TPR) repeat protein
MSTRFTVSLSVVVVLIVGSLRAELTYAQIASASSLADQIKAKYKLARIVPDSNGYNVAEPGTMLEVQKEGILGMPIRSNSVEPVIYAIQKDAVLHHSAATAGTRQFEVGEKVYVTKLDIDATHDKVIFMIVECDCSDPGKPSFYKSVVDFEFPGGYLAGAEVSQIENVISQVLAIPDASSGDVQQETRDEPPPPAPSCGSYEACIKMAQTLFSSSQWARSLTRFQEASQLDESKGDAWAGIGYTYFQMGQYDDSVSAFDKALHLGATLSAPVCHATGICGDTGFFLLSTKEVAFVNKRGEKEFLAAPSAVTSEGPVLFHGQSFTRHFEAYYLQIRFGKNWRFYYLPPSLQCSPRFACPEPGLTQQSKFAEYIHAALARMAAGDFGSQPNKP